MDNELVKEYLEVSEKHSGEVEGNWFFFNRLNVPKKIRGNGLGNKLMQLTIEWADEEKINILNNVNPYGDFTMEDLTAFYKKFGFEEVFEGLMVRKFRRREEDGKD